MRCLGEGICDLQGSPAPQRPAWDRDHFPGASPAQILAAAGENQAPCAPFCCPYPCLVGWKPARQKGYEELSLQVGSGALLGVGASPRVWGSSRSRTRGRVGSRCPETLCKPISDLKTGTCPGQTRYCPVQSRAEPGWGSHAGKGQAPGTPPAAGPRLIPAAQLGGRVPHQPQASLAPSHPSRPCPVLPFALEFLRSICELSTACDVTTERSGEFCSTGLSGCSVPLLCLSKHMGGTIASPTHSCPVQGQGLGTSRRPKPQVRGDSHHLH